MTLADNQIQRLWQSFMPRRKEIQHRISIDLYSLQIYPFSFDFADREKPFEKWAAVEVENFDNVPQGLEAFTLAGGLYAVFAYKGSSSDIRIFEHIFGSWLPQSNDYVLDDRPHFEILGSKYRNNDPESEEEIWIPIKPK